MAIDVISEAKDVVTSHESIAMAGNLDGVMSNIADDIVVLAYGFPLVDGKAAFRDFYAGMMAGGRMKFGHDYTGDDVIADDLVLLRGVSRGAMTTHEGHVSEFSNNFVHILKKGINGSFKLWRAAFAPDSPAPLTGE